ncbi:MAG TPA: GDP-mannose 4,6-dehydratase [Candidatus Obscuribacterales bacterium]
MKRALITGITGMAGSHLADYILSEHPDVEVYGTKRWRSQIVNIEHALDRLNLIDCDLTDPFAVSALIGKIRPDYIFHLAAQSFVPESWKGPHATITDNITMQLNLFEAVRAHEIDPVIQVALSSEEYGKVHPDEVPINENNPLRPLSPYAVSKVAQDMLGYQYFESYGLKVIRTRAFNHEGPRRGDVFVTSNFAKQIAESELGLKPPVVSVGNLEAQRDWTDVRDMARAYWLSVHHCQPGEVYVIASGVARTVKQLLDCLMKESHIPLSIKVDPDRLRPSDVMILQGDASKFKKATGWTTTYSFEQTMGDLLDYWRQRLAPRFAVQKSAPLPLARSAAGGEKGGLSVIDFSPSTAREMPDVQQVPGMSTTQTVS